MDIYAEKDFGKILKHNATALRHDLLETETNCFRIYDRNLSAFPVTVDLYADHARVVDFGEEPLTEEDKATCFDIISRMVYIDLNKIIYVYRNKREGREQHQKTDNQATIVNVLENGLTFKTDLTTYADTGLFLDQMPTRLLIKERSAGCDVLNLFSYTGSFSVYAASGRAKTVTSVDLSATYTKWAEENLKANGFAGDNYKCICCDAEKFLEEADQNHQKFDIVIFDPPSFSNSHKMDHDFDVQRDFVQWIKNICRILREDGFILFSTNLGTFKIDKRRLRGLGVNEISARVMAPGFVKGRKGTVRSWIMTVDDNSLTLDWSEDKKPVRTKRENTEPRRRDEDRPRRDFHRDDDRPRRRVDDDRPRRDFHRDEEGPRRRFDDERPRRDFHRDEERPRRRFDDDRPGRDFHRDEERPRRRFDDDRPRRDFHRDEERPRRRFDDERPRREFHRDQDCPRPKSEYRSTERSSRRERPYGYDSFKPARSRNDSSQFFWNDEDK